MNNSKVLPLCYYGHSALRQQCSDIPHITNEICLLSQQMIASMKANEGIGLAGPQIGRNINIITLDIPGNLDESCKVDFISPGERDLLSMMPLVLVNLKLTKYSENKTPYVEGCLSIPGVTAEVYRPDKIQIEAQLLDGRKIDYWCGGLLGRCLQHEYDHLKGILFIDLISTDDRKMIEKRLKKIKKEYG